MAVDVEDDAAAHDALAASDEDDKGGGAVHDVDADEDGGEDEGPASRLKNDLHNHLMPGA